MSASRRRRGVELKRGLAVSMGWLLFSPSAQAAAPTVEPTPRPERALQLEATGQALWYFGSSCFLEGDTSQCATGALLVGGQGALLYRAPWLGVGIVGGALVHPSSTGIVSTSGSTASDRFTFCHADVHGRLYAPVRLPSWLELWLGLDAGFANATDARTETQSGVVTAYTDVNQYGFHGKLAVGVAFYLYEGLFLGGQLGCPLRQARAGADESRSNRAYALQ